MSYYHDKGIFLGQLDDVIRNSKGNKLKISKLSITFGKRFGFSRKMILSALKLYEDADLVMVNERKDEVVVLGKNKE